MMRLEEGLTPSYVNRFVRRNCASDLLEVKFDLRWDAKEITESESVRHAAGEILEVDYRDPDVLAIVVGDGSRPRTGALIAFTTKWRAVSIDPLLTSRRPEVDEIQRLRCVSKKVQHVSWQEAYERDLADIHTVILIAPHSHAKLSLCEHLMARPDPAVTRHVVALECCVPMELPNRSPNYAYDDRGCFSPARRMKVWRDIPWPAFSEPEPVASYAG